MSIKPISFVCRHSWLGEPVNIPQLSLFFSSLSTNTVSTRGDLLCCIRKEQAQSISYEACFAVTVAADAVILHISNVQLSSFVCLYTILIPLPEACSMRNFFSGASALTACKPTDRRPTNGPLSTE